MILQLLGTSIFYVRIGHKLKKNCGILNGKGE
jgi:hypothetical protein